MTISIPLIALFFLFCLFFGWGYVRGRDGAFVDMEGLLKSMKDSNTAQGRRIDQLWQKARRRTRDSERG